MAWKRIERIQTPDALFLHGTEAELTPILDHVRALPLKSVLYSGLELAQGHIQNMGQDVDVNWLAVFGTPMQADGDIVLPRLETALSLYTFEPDCWLPVGVGLDMPEHVQQVFIESMRNQHDLGSWPIIIIPKFKPGNNVTLSADIYRIKERVQLARLAMSSQDKTSSNNDTAPNDAIKEIPE